MLASGYTPTLWNVCSKRTAHLTLPRFGIQAFSHHTGLYPPSDKSLFTLYSQSLLIMPLVRIFVSILLSGTPASVNQLVITQLYNPAGTAHTLAMFLLLQCKRDSLAILTLLMLWF